MKPKKRTFYSSWRRLMGDITQKQAAALFGYTTSYWQQIELGTCAEPRLLRDACENKLHKAKIVVDCTQ